MYYLHDRYQNIIGHQGHICFVDQFPAFHDVIQQKVQQGYKHENHDGPYEESHGLAFLPLTKLA